MSVDPASDLRARVKAAAIPRKKMCEILPNSPASIMRFTVTAQKE